MLEFWIQELYNKFEESRQQNVKVKLDVSVVNQRLAAHGHPDAQE